MNTERVKFRLIRMPCCGMLLCWVNPRYPNHCPECGKSIFANIHQHVLVTDDDAVLQLTVEI